ncbi:MAG: alpha/beta hydrolase-fold protein [Bacteroidales bacterium]|nr:alpha/beta hydrolase-fold protein [Bacteroidales bacterium]
MRRPILLLISVLACVVAAHARYITLTDSLVGSAIYPGTVHTFSVTVPDAYDGSHPAALYLGLDGILCNAPEVIDSLSATGAIPVTIGVYLQPGIVRADDGRVLRYNRSNEFDATDDRFATFLASELLPAVSRITIPDGRPLRLSDDTADRMIFGLSSGGIAAFTAAWHRPDLFGKIYSGCGTFVPMRGGNDLQAIVRKHEPRPLRIYLQDGYTDSWNPLFGSWYEANRMLASALVFAGYDCGFDWAPGGHSIRRTSEIFPDVMTWMWRDRPSSLSAGTSANNYLAPLLDGAGRWQPAALPVPVPAPRARAVYPDSTIIVTRTAGSNCLTQYIVDRHGRPACGQPFYWLHTYGNSLLTVHDMTFDADGNLWVLTPAGIQICDHNGRVRGILSLPCALAPDAAIDLRDGLVIIISDGRAYTRRLNIAAPRPGHTPPSQGQA